MGTTYSIKALEHLTGIKAHTLRIWEQRYSIVEPLRTETNIRYYTDEDLKTLLNVAVLIQKGWRISKVADLSREALNLQVLDLALISGDFPSQISRMLRATIDLDEPTFSAILDRSIEEVGQEVTFTKIVGKFIQQIGVLWQTDAIGVAHEHFASNLIKQKLYAALDALPAISATRENPAYLLFLPDQELHELGLLYMHYLLKAKGAPVIYLGQSVPMEFLAPLLKTPERWKALVSIWTTQPDVDGRDAYIQRISAMLQGIPFYITGLGSHDWEGSPSFIGLEVLPDLPSLTQALASAVAPT